MADETIVLKARETGWMPLEEFRGSPDRWVDADTWVRRGEEMIPILKANNRKLEQEVAQTRQEIQKLIQAVQEGQDSMNALKEYHQEDVKRQIALAREDLKRQLVVARKADDVDSEVEIQAQLMRLDSPAAEKKELAKKEDDTPQPHPDFQAWHADNPWYGINHEATALAYGVAESLRGSGLTGRAFMDKVTERVAQRFPELFPGRSPKDSSTSGYDRETFSKVEGSRIGSSRPNGKSYADLPQDARDACERQAVRLVGKNRAYKTVDDYRAYYVNMYFDKDLYA